MINERMWTIVRCWCPHCASGAEGGSAAARSETLTAAAGERDARGRHTKHASRGLRSRSARASGAVAMSSMFSSKQRPRAHLERARKAARARRWTDRGLVGRSLDGVTNGFERKLERTERERDQRVAPEWSGEAEEAPPIAPRVDERSQMCERYKLVGPYSWWSAAPARRKTSKY